MNKKNFWQKSKKPILALAPMAGVTDSAFRQICRENGADVVYSEMASVSALFFKPKRTLELIKFNKNERPYVVQLFGKDPKHFAKAAKIVSEKIKPDGIDINFGCPAKKVFGHGSGCALMMDIKLAREIISAVCENTKLPVSIKIRAGVKKGILKGTFKGTQNKSAINALAFIKKTADLPYSAIMIHGRTYEGGFSGPVNFSLMEKIKKEFPDKIILANGGINSAEEAVEILKKHPSLDGLGIARGTWGQPWIFEEIKKLFKKEVGADLGSARKRTNTRFVPTKYDFSYVKKIALRHAKLIYKNKGQQGIFEIRKHMSWYVKGFPGASELRRKLVMAKDLREIKQILDNNKI